VIQYTFEKRGDMLVVETNGFDESLEEVIAYNDAVKAEAAKLECDKILADERGLEYRLSVIDTYELGDYLSRTAAMFAKIAIVTNEGNREAAQFWENVASNRGIVVRVFYAFEEAEEWLS